MTGWREHLPAVAGRIVLDAPLAPYTWLRVGGPADVLYLPKDEADLEAFLKVLDPSVPVTILGVGSNTLVRDGGIDGVVIRLGRAFAQIKTVSDDTLYAGAAALDAQVSRVAAEAGIADLEFYTGVPGVIGGAMTMNAGCYGSETKGVLLEAYGLTRTGRRTILSNADMGFSYRKAEAAQGKQGDLIFTGALFRGPKDDPRAIAVRMAEITASREASQPIREKTGGSTFRNPVVSDGVKLSAWKLVDDAGWRGKRRGGAMFSPQHANFLINTGEASAADLEGLGEAVRADVLEKTGIELHWEIKRVGRPL